jgi:UDP-N-acetylglucosamine/UDP-N-acetylgalactosamine diphosphorylase
MLVMTSAINHRETVDEFKSHNFYGADSSSFVFFQQSVLPAVDLNGKVIMKSPCEVQLSPNGNGALFEAINTNLQVKKILKSVDYVQVIGVDNVLNRVLDPVHVGYTAAMNLDASLKCCVKRSADEKVGVVCKKNGKYDIVEYSELSEELSTKTSPEDPSKLYLELGNILMFMLKSQKLLDLCSDTESLNKLYHKAFKKIEQWDEET